MVKVVKYKRVVEGGAGRKLWVFGLRGTKRYERFTHCGRDTYSAAPSTSAGNRAWTGRMVRVKRTRRTRRRMGETNSKK